MKQKKLTFLSVRSELRDRHISIFTFEEFRRIFQSSLQVTKYFLETYAKKGMFVRLKQGLYAFESRMPTAEEIANALYKPSYISFEYALAKYGIIPEIVYTVTSATTKPSRVFEARDLAFEYHKIKKQAFTGYALIKEQSIRASSMLIAEPEKALVDYLYFVALGKREWNDRIEIKHLKKDKITGYAKLYERAGLLELIKRL
ncbi:MAG TPA: hypothetical protein VJC15_03145 [Candidatus Paceibacterota bacterium]